MLSIKKLKTIYADEGFRRYLVNTSWMFSEKIIRLLVGLLVASQVARYLGVENYGVINYGISFVMILSSFATLGIEDILVSRLVQKEHEENLLMGTAFFLRLAASLLAVFVIGFATYVVAHDVKVSVYISIISLGTIFQPFNVIDLFFQSRVQSRFLATASLFSLLVCAAIRIYLVSAKAPLVSFVWVVFLESVLLAAGLIFFYVKGGHNIFKWRFDKKLAKILCRHSFPIALTAVIIAIYMRIDQIIIRNTLDIPSVGVYSAAARVSELWYFIPMAIGSSLFPAIINAKKISEELYLKRLQQLYDLMSVLSISIALFVSFFSPYIIQVLFGSKFAEAADVLTIHIWAGVFVFLGVANSKFTVMENLTHTGLYRTIIGVVVNVGLNLILIPQFGIKGAAFTALICQCVTSYLGNFLWKRSRTSFYIATRSLNPIGVFKRFRSGNAHG